MRVHPPTHPHTHTYTQTQTHLAKVDGGTVLRLMHDGLRQGCVQCCRSERDRTRNPAAGSGPRLHSCGNSTTQKCLGFRVLSLRFVLKAVWDILQQDCVGVVRHRERAGGGLKKKKLMDFSSESRRCRLSSKRVSRCLRAGCSSLGTIDADARSGGGSTSVVRVLLTGGGSAGARSGRGSCR